MLKSVNLLRTVVIVVIFVFIVSAIALADNFKILDPGILSDSPAYELKLKLEEKELAALNDPIEKAKFLLKIADLRLVEAMIMEEMDKPQFVNNLVKDYKKNLTQALLSLAEALSEERPGVDEALAVVSDTASKDIDILEGLLDLIKSGEIPEESQVDIELAVKISQVVRNVSIDKLIKTAAGELKALPLLDDDVDDSDDSNDSYDEALDNAKDANDDDTDDNNDDKDDSNYSNDSDDDTQDHANDDDKEDSNDDAEEEDSNNATVDSDNDDD
jgi:hypothetical protein